MVIPQIYEKYSRYIQIPVPNLSAYVDTLENSSMYRRTSINHLSIRTTCSDSSPKRFTAFLRRRYRYSRRFSIRRDSRSATRISHDLCLVNASDSLASSSSCLAFSGFNECETPFFVSFIIRQKIIITNKIQKLSGRVIILQAID